ncbi:ABC transporter permease [Patulibacter defluvii]|uniref:ABC transporter permease n=1 Tax=Patulibacter defluvii TaxID=3095358 RepID=UPI002A75BF19|nr:FtsX-like permease family protein [Patulibacter sp. DM4]
MRALLLRGLRAHLRRTLMTALAVVLGVALVAGTLVYTDTIGRSFDNLTEATNRGADVIVTPNSEEGVDSFGSDPPQMPRSVLAKVRGADGVRDATGVVGSQQLVVFEKNGRDRLGSGFAPGVLSGDERGAAWFGSTRYASGHAPRADGEIALDKAAAEKGGYALGDRVPVQLAGPQRRLTLVGTVELEGVGSFGGATVALTTQRTAAALAARTPGNYFSTVAVRRDEGVSVAQLERSVRAAVGGAATVRSAAAESSKQAQDIKDGLSFLPTILLVFAGIATFVGAFLIFNTFSITVAQRQREHALLRALGATRGQIRRQVLGESLAIGVLGSVVGVAAGLVVAPGLRSLMAAFEIDFPSTATVVAPRTVVVGLLVGILVTMVASFVPAARATRVPPVEALREAAAPPARGRVRRGGVIAGAVLAAIGTALLLLAVAGTIDGDGGSAAAGVGAGLLFVGTALLSPILVAPLATIVGGPMTRLFGLPGRLARDNAVRQPGRTAVTAAALMVGLALMVFATVFASGIRETLRGDLDAAVGAPLVVQSRDGGTSSLPPDLPAALRRQRDVQAAGAVGFVAAKAAGEDLSLNVADRGVFDGGLLRLHVAGGRPVRDPGPDEILLGKDDAKTLHATVGRTVTVVGANTRRLRLRVTGVIADGGFTMDGSWVAPETARRLADPRPAFVLVRGNAEPAALEKALADGYPGVEAQAKDDWITTQTKQVDQLLMLVYALLALSVIVAVFGIVNTLSLSIAERVREIGLLRAVGATQAQVRRMVTIEALITALLGAALGVVLGFVLATAVGATLDGFALTVPVGSVAILVVVAALAGVLAARPPARRAARTDVLVAIADE